MFDGPERVMWLALFFLCIISALGVGMLSLFVQNRRLRARVADLEEAERRRDVLDRQAGERLRGEENRILSRGNLTGFGPVAPP